MARNSNGILSLLLIAGVLALGAYYRSHPTPGRPAAASITQPGHISEEHFSPEEDLERLDVTRLQQARRSVDVAMYAFTDRYLAEELAELARHGIVIRIYRDREQFEDEERHASEHRYESTTDLLRGVPNLQIRVKPSGRRDLMHLKAFVIDGTLLRDGSANWSNAGLKVQDNNVRYTDDAAEVRSFEQAFEEMWARPGNTTVQ